LVFFAIETILVIFYYANADTRTPVFVGMGCVLLHILLTWLFIHWYGYLGIALAYVIQKTVKNLILLGLLRNKIPVEVRKVGVFCIKLLIASLGFVLVLGALKVTFYSRFDSGLFTKALFLGVTVLLACMCYLLILVFSGIISFKRN
jgi:peptidoglycan biosynthesis protein MviN/MurJ (putative lipid II flippase)